MKPARHLMLSALVSLAIAPVATKCTLAQGMDRVRTDRGATSGEVQSTTPLELTVKKGSTGSETVPVNEVRSVIFHDEPNELTQARSMINDARGYREALDRLQRIDIDDLSRDLVKQDLEFYRALCAARLALAGEGELRDAGRQMMAFQKQYRNSYHYFEASEVLGDLLVAAGSPSLAERQYKNLAKAPWPEYKARSSLLVGRALQSQDKHDEAIEKFDQAIQLAGESDQGQPQRLAATLGKAISQASAGEVNQAVAMIEDVIAGADPENASLHAQAYNALGDCYRQAEKPKDALLAYLHVDVLYSSAGDRHAEALAHLASLWETVGQEGRAREARRKLEENYANSRWAP